MESTFIPTDLKVKAIDAIAAAGISKIEVTSFVHPKVIPQMADSVEVMRRIKRVPGVTYSALIPNLTGARRAAEARVDAVRLVVTATETYNRKNVGMSVDESLEICRAVIRELRPSGISVEAVIGVAFGCPFEGRVPEARVIELAHRFADMGIQELSVADSAGLGNPAQVQEVMGRLADELKTVVLSLHLHNTRGLGLANVVAAMQVGIDTFDSSIGGLGGCPITKVASGNIPTEDLVNMCEEMGVHTGVDIKRIQDISGSLGLFLGKPLSSLVLSAGTPDQLYAKMKS
jgi:hydroxymethylglutaryl-CoA lyase